MPTLLDPVPSVFLSSMLPLCICYPTRQNFISSIPPALDQVQLTAPVLLFYNKEHHMWFVVDLFRKQCFFCLLFIFYFSLFFNITKAWSSDKLPAVKILGFFPFALLRSTSLLPVGATLSRRSALFRSGAVGKVFFLIYF